MYVPLIPKPPQCKDQCVTHALQWPSLGQETISLNSIFKGKWQKKTCQERKKKKILTSCSQNSLSTSDFPIQGVEVRLYLAHSRFNILPVSDLCFHIHPEQRKEMCETGLHLENLSNGPFRGDVLVMETFRACLSTTQHYLLNTFNQ